MSILTGILIGAIGGWILGYCLEFASCVLAFITCSADSAVGVLTRPMAIFGAIIGALVGIYIEMEERKQKEQNVKDMVFNEWKKKLDDCFDSIRGNMDTYCENGFMPGEIYNPIWELQKVQTEERYKKSFNEALNSHINWLRNIIDDNIAKPGYYGISVCISAMRCLRGAYRDDSGFNYAIDILERLYKRVQCDTYYIEPTQYGDYILRISNLENSIDLNIKINELEDKLQKLNDSLKQDLGIYYENLNQQLPNYIDYAAELMWCRAVRRPFNHDEFRKVGAWFDRYTLKSMVDNHITTVSYFKEMYRNNRGQMFILEHHVERWLADIYAKNLIGGKNTVYENKEVISEWVNHMVYLKNSKECFLLASGLAWMGLYEFERDVLRQLVSCKVNLPADLQDRLGFLESGGTSNIKIYDVDEVDFFLYDSSATEWNTDAYNLLFRKMEMTHKDIKYSLAISQWTKTLPLAKGQKITQEQIEKAFSNLIEEFDGEITVNKEKAKAINHVNVEYDNSFIFRFNSKRNRCASLLFSSEKYGQNLNITIITMFTPEVGLTNEELKKYALAIKENIYIESFKESVRQAIDEIIDIKQEIYGDELSNKTVFS